MKELIVLVIFLSLVIFAIFMAVTKKIDRVLTSIILCFSIISGISIANYDIVKRYKWGNIEVEIAKKEINEVKDAALSEITKEISNQKDAIRLLMSDANNTRENIERQKSELNRLISTATELQEKIIDQKNKITALKKSAENTKKDIENLNNAASQIALILVRATYFTIETKSEFGTNRSQMAIQEIINDLNKILPMVIPNEKERLEWIKKLQSTLPPPNH